MPPKVKFTREEIIRAALDIVRETGPEGLTARSLAARLGCSVKPIFGLFRSMEEVQQEVLAAGYRLYGQTIAQAMEAGKYPPYKASGMAYIAFAQQEKPLFRLLFMRDRSHEDASPRLGDDVEPLLDLDVYKRQGQHVQPQGGLIQKQDLRPGDQSHGDAQPPLPAAGELPGPAGQNGLQPQGPGQLLLSLIHI